MFVLGIAHILLFRTQLERQDKAGAGPRTQAGDMGRLPASSPHAAQRSRGGGLGSEWRGQQLKAKHVHPRVCWGQCPSTVSSYRKRERSFLHVVFRALGAWWVLGHQPFVLHLRVAFQSLMQTGL